MTFHPSSVGVASGEASDKNHHPANTFSAHFTYINLVASVRLRQCHLVNFELFGAKCDLRCGAIFHASPANGTSPIVVVWLPKVTMSRGIFVYLASYRMSWPMDDFKNLAADLARATFNRINMGITSSCALSAF